MRLALRQSTALFRDAYQELNARRLFWITLAISAAVVLGFAAIGINPRGVTLLWWEFPNDLINARVLEPSMLYRFLLAHFAIPWWLGWGATILGLATTASLIPDFIASGAVELVLARPISRVRLFLTKYAAGLLFAALQVAVFSLAVFVVLGLRSGAWDARVFLAIPLVVVFFSYLYSVCALLGLVTRSTLAALLLTLVFWLLIAGVHGTESTFLALRTGNELRQERLAALIEQARAQEARHRALLAEPHDPEHPSPARIAAELGALQARQRLEDLSRRLEQTRQDMPWLTRGHTIVLAVKTLLPKTAETIALLDRALLTPEEVARFRPREDGIRPEHDDAVRISPRALARRLDQVRRTRTLAWILGTSLVFEGGVLALACVLFARRDF